jgi:D-alanyl-D-alanine carboxypeptidase
MNVSIQILSGALILSIAGGVIAYNMTQTHYNAIITELQTEIASSTEALNALTYEKTELIQKVAEKEQDIVALDKKYKRADQKADDLKKIIETDKELLQKYSKVFFLNENYTPEKLESIPFKFVSNPEKTLEFHAEALNFLEDMLNDALDDDITLKVLSAYRSFDTQSALKTSYKVTYGAGTANAFSADQGYSEHQLGTTVDLTTTLMGASLSTSFENTDAFKWLTEHAYRYGFILSYPKGNTYYQYEPWHWRFVGKDLARKLNKENKNFYDLDQRDINEYLGEIFD